MVVTESMDHCCNACVTIISRSVEDLGKQLFPSLPQKARFLRTGNLSSIAFNYYVFQHDACCQWPIGVTVVILGC